MKKLLISYLFFSVVFVVNAQNLSIAGNIKTAKNAAICNAAVQLNDENGNVLASTTSDASGNYRFENLASNMTYTLSVSIEEKSVDGISTYDAILLSNHILNIRKIDDPFTLLALDVNYSESLTTFDLLTMRKFILRIDDRFVLGNWKFFASDANMDNTDDISITTRVYENLSTSIQNADFTGYKVGDADNSFKFTCN